MDRDEVSDWIMPDDFDHVESEAKHLIAESDADKVKSLLLSYRTQIRVTKLSKFRLGVENFVQR